MAQEIYGKTRVIFKDKCEMYDCDDFPTVWKVLSANGYSIDEENKGYLIRILFIAGEYDVNENLRLEVIW